MLPKIQGADFAAEPVVPLLGKESDADHHRPAGWVDASNFTAHRGGGDDATGGYRLASGRQTFIEPGESGKLTDFFSVG